MWVSRKEWLALKGRVSDLESARKYDESGIFRIYDPAVLSSLQVYSAGWGQEVPCQKITVKDVLQRVLSHLGLSLTYVKGTPESVELKGHDAAHDATKEI